MDTENAENVVEQLRKTLELARQLAERLESTLPRVEPSTPPNPQLIAELEKKLAAYKIDQEELTSRLVDTEHKAHRLMNLYVALYQLHESLKPESVRSAIVDITVNLLGAEHFALLLYESDQRTSDIFVAESSGRTALDSLCMGGRYIGGDPMIDATLADGVLRLGPKEQSSVLAAIPLSIQEHPVGALVISKLLDHKPAFGNEDRDLLNLLAVHAGSALHAASVHVKPIRRNGRSSHGDERGSV